MDIFGIIGGLYEMLTLTIGIFVGRFVDRFFRKNLVKDFELKKTEWFSYPSSIQPTKGKSNKVQPKEVGDVEESKH